MVRSTFDVRVLPSNSMRTQLTRPYSSANITHAARTPATTPATTP